MFNPFFETPPVTVEKIVEENARSLNNPSVLYRVPADRVRVVSLQHYCETSAELFCKVMVSYRQNHFGVISMNVQISITEDNTNDVCKLRTRVWPKAVRSPRWIVESVDPHLWCSAPVALGDPRKQPLVFACS